IAWLSGAGQENIHPLSNFESGIVQTNFVTPVLAKGRIASDAFGPIITSSIGSHIKIETQGISIMTPKRSAENVAALAESIHVQKIPPSVVLLEKSPANSYIPILNANGTRTAANLHGIRTHGESLQSSKENL